MMENDELWLHNSPSAESVIAEQARFMRKIKEFPHHFGGLGGLRTSHIIWFGTRNIRRRKFELQWKAWFKDFFLMLKMQSSRSRIE